MTLQTVQSCERIGDRSGRKGLFIHGILVTLQHQTLTLPTPAEVTNATANPQTLKNIAKNLTQLPDVRDLLRRGVVDARVTPLTFGYGNELPDAVKALYASSATGETLAFKILEMLGTLMEGSVLAAFFRVEDTVGGTSLGTKAVKDSLMEVFEAVGKDFPVESLITTAGDASTLTFQMWTEAAAVALFMETTAGITAKVEAQLNDKAALETVRSVQKLLKKISDDAGVQATVLASFFATVKKSATPNIWACKIDEAKLSPFLEGIRDFVKFSLLNKLFDSSVDLIGGQPLDEVIRKALESLHDGSIVTKYLGKELPEAKGALCLKVPWFAFRQPAYLGSRWKNFSDCLRVAKPLWATQELYLRARRLKDIAIAALRELTDAYDVGTNQFLDANPFTAIAGTLHLCIVVTEQLKNRLAELETSLSEFTTEFPDGKIAEALKQTKAKFGTMVSQNVLIGGTQIQSITRLLEKLDLTPLINLQDAIDSQVQQNFVPGNAHIENILAGRLAAGGNAPAVAQLNSIHVVAQSVMGDIRNLLTTLRGVPTYDFAAQFKRPLWDKLVEHCKNDVAGIEAELMRSVSPISTSQTQPHLEKCTNWALTAGDLHQDMKRSRPTITTPLADRIEAGEEWNARIAVRDSWTIHVGSMITSMPMDCGAHFGQTGAGAGVADVVTEIACRNHLNATVAERQQTCQNLENVAENVMFKAQYTPENSIMFLTKELGVRMGGGNILSAVDQLELNKKAYASREDIAKLEEELYLTFLLYLGNPDKYKEQLAKCDKKFKDLAKQLNLPETAFGLLNWEYATHLTVDCPIALALTKPGQQTIHAHAEELCTFRNFAKEKVPICDFPSATYTKGVNAVWNQLIDDLCKSYPALLRPVVAEAMRTASYFSYLIAKTATTKPPATQSPAPPPSYFPAMSIKELQKLVRIIELVARGMLMGGNNGTLVTKVTKGWVL